MPISYLKILPWSYLFLVFIILLCIYVSVSNVVYYFLCL